MTSPRRRPTLSAPLGPKGRAALARRVADINERGAEARARLAEASGRDPGRADVGRTLARAGAVDPLVRSIAKAESNALHLAERGNRAEAARAERTAAGLRVKLAKQQRAAAAVVAGESLRSSRLDRLAVLIQRSDVLTAVHYAIADRWLAAIDAAADGELARPAAMPEADDQGTDGPLPPPSGPAIFLSGPSVLSRWSKAVPVEAVESGRRTVPPTFDPKRIKAQRRGPGDAPREGVQAACHQRRSRAVHLGELFACGVSAAGHPDWCAAVAIRVILHNQGLCASCKALGVRWSAENSRQAQSAMAAGLEALSGAVQFRA